MILILILILILTHSDSDSDSDYDYDSDSDSDSDSFLNVFVVFHCFMQTKHFSWDNLPSFSWFDVDETLFHDSKFEL